MRKTPENVRILLRGIEQAAAHGTLYALDAFDRVTGRQVFLLCAKSPVPGTDQVDLLPLCEIIDQDVYQRYAPAKADGEGYADADRDLQ